MVVVNIWLWVSVFCFYTPLTNVTWMSICGTINKLSKVLKWLQNRHCTGREEYVKTDCRGYETIGDNVHIHFISVQNYYKNWIRIRHSGRFFFSYLGFVGFDKGRKFKTKFAESILHEQLSIFVHVSALIKSNNTDITISEIDKLINIFTSWSCAIYFRAYELLFTWLDNNSKII